MAQLIKLGGEWIDPDRVVNVWNHDEETVKVGLTDTYRVSLEDIDLDAIAATINAARSDAPDPTQDQRSVFDQR